MSKAIILANDGKVETYLDSSLQKYPGFLKKIKQKETINLSMERINHLLDLLKTGLLNPHDSDYHDHLIILGIIEILPGTSFVNCRGQYLKVPDTLLSHCEALSGYKEELLDVSPVMMKRVMSYLQGKYSSEDPIFLYTLQQLKVRTYLVHYPLDLARPVTILYRPKAKEKRFIVQDGEHIVIFPVYAWQRKERISFRILSPQIYLNQQTIPCQAVNQTIESKDWLEPGQTYAITFHLEIVDTIHKDLVTGQTITSPCVILLKS